MTKCLFNLVYFSSRSCNTHRFVEKLNIENATRLPLDIDSETIVYNSPFILLTPTYAGGDGFLEGAVPKQVIKFLNVEKNRQNCKAVLASGNTNFHTTYCLAGDIISKKLNIPFLYKFELLGNIDDPENLTQVCNKFWTENNL